MKNEETIVTVSEVNREILDREMIELAAESAGIILEWDGDPEKWIPIYYKGKTYHYFDPLTHNIVET
jgi:hypothetical protein